MYLNLAVGFVSVFAVIYYFFTRKYNYWKNKNVPHLKPLPLFGNYFDLLTFKSAWPKIDQSICQKFPNAPLIGLYYGPEPALIVQDPEYIKLVTTKDFYYFSGREISDYSEKEWLLRNLFSIHAHKWKVLRQNLTPLFSSAKLKNMFYIVEKSAKTFETLLEKEIKISRTQEVRTLYSRFTMENIGTSAFGIDTKTMSDDENNPFRHMARRVFLPNYEMMLRYLVRTMYPAIYYGLGFKALPPAVETFFLNLFSSVFEERQHKPASKHDFVDLILTFGEKKYITGDSIDNVVTGKNEKVQLDVTDELLMSQCVLIFSAGFETSATTASYTLYELAKDRSSQERARREILDWLKKNDGQLTYECVTELPFLEQCINETLRLYPVLGVITREVTAPYRFPNGVTVDKGTRVHLPVYHIHHNPDYFPEPEVFRPERFAPENKHKIRPYTYFPFGEGPRLCIGMRFAKMQVMAGLVTILKKYRVELAEGMPRTIEVDPRTIITTSTLGIQLDFIPLGEYSDIKT